MPQRHSYKALLLVLTLCAGMLLGAANTHLHLDNDKLSCTVCLLADHHSSVIDTTVRKLHVQPVTAITQPAVSLSLQQAILGFLIRGPPSTLPL